MRKALKITLYTLGSILLLLVICIALLNTRQGQNFVRGKAVTFLQKKLKTEVRIGYLGVGFPKYIVIEDVLLRDEAKDTLLSVGLLKIDISMLKLISKQVDVQQIVLKNVHSHIYRNAPDTTYNFSYIIAAFAGEPKAEDTTKTKDTTGKEPLVLSLDKVLLKDIHLRMEDHTGGMGIALDLEHLLLRMKKMDLEHMVMHIKELEVAGLSTKYTQDTSLLPPKTDTSKEPTKLQLIADNLQLERIDFGYADNINKLLFGLNLGTLELQLNKLDLEKSLVDVQRLAINNTRSTLVMGKYSKPPGIVDTIVHRDTTGGGWHVVAGAVQMNAVDFKMDNENMPQVKKGIDYSHLDIKDLAVQLKGLMYDGDTLAGEMQRLSVREKSGVKVDELKTKFTYGPHGAELKDLYLATPHTVLRDHVAVHYKSLEAVKTDLPKMQVDIDVKQSLVGVQDLLLFVPELENIEIVHRYPKGQIRLDTRITGTVGNMNIAKLYVLSMNGTELLANGRLNGLPDANKLRYAVHVTRLTSSRKGVEDFVPDSTLTAVRLPDKFTISGDVAGTVKDYTTDLNLTSTDGAAYVKGTLSMGNGKNNEQYDMLVQTTDLNLGRILKQDTLMGTISAAITVKGKGLDPKQMNAIVNGAIGHAQLKGYDYTNITFKAQTAGQKATLQLISKDPNAQIAIAGTADLSKKYVAAKGDVLIDSINLQALQLYKTPLTVSGDMHIDFPVLNPDYPEGTFVWNKPVVHADGKRYYMDSMYIKSKPTAEKGQDITANLDVLYAHVTGKTPLTKIGGIVTERLNRRYTAPEQDTVSSMATFIPITPPAATPKDTTTLPPTYDLQLTAYATDRPMLHSMLPQLQSFDSVKIDGRLTERQLMLSVVLPTLTYGTNTIQNAVAKINGTDSAFTYKVTVDKAGSKDLAIYYADIHGNLEQDRITTNISIADSGKKERFALAAQMVKAGDSQVISLMPGLKLDYDDWQVAQPNSIVLVKDGYFVNNFEISHMGQMINAQSETQAADAPMELKITNFQIANLTGIVSKDTTLATGVLNANVTYEKGQDAAHLDGRLDIKNLAVLNDTVGDIKASANNQKADELAAKVTITGRGNDIAMDGSYYLKGKDGNDFDLNADIKALALRSYEALTMKQIRNSSGYLRGNLNIKGTPLAPKINGELSTDNLATTITAINSYFRMPNEKVTFKGDKVNFDNFTIQDSSGNKADIDGIVSIADITEPKFDLKLKANKWRAIHSTVADNKVFYGDLFITTNLSIEGTPGAPKVEGNMNILKGTNMTVVNPQKDPEIESRKGIVVIVNYKDSARRRATAANTVKRDTVKRKKLDAGSDINVNISVDKSAQFSLILDQTEGDFISVQGTASINASVSPNGTVGLTGNYELTGGAYQLNYNFIKRKFLIKNGSTITFAGDPVTGTIMDVTAVYEAIVPPYDLVERQVTEQTQLNYYKQRIPFDVELKLKGAVLKPSITFDIALPENKVYPLSSDQIELVQAKLTQVRTDTGELNKQVFAVLILNRFVSDDPFKSNASQSVSSTALQSVSRFIGEQLNDVAGRLVKGVDLSVDLATTEDYTTGSMRQRTDLSLAASKQLLNDRLKLTLGNNFELDGPQSKNQQSSFVPSNLAADYLLSPEGKYTLRAYRRAYDEGVLEGFVTETGLNFIVSLDYNKFKNVLHPAKQSSSRTTTKKTDTTAND